MVAKDPTEDKLSGMPRGEPDGLGLMSGRGRDEWRLEKVSREESEVAGEAHRLLGGWWSGGSDSGDWVNLPRSENRATGQCDHHITQSYFHYCTARHQN